MLSNLTTINGYNPIKALFLKEFWDNKRAILVTPMVVAGLVMFFSVVAIINGSGLTIDGESMSAHLAAAEHEINSEEASSIITLLAAFPSIIIFIVLVFSMVFTALSVLYDERKDKSVLFWKSMPVSDTQEVLVKLATITVVTPLIAVAFAFIVQLFSALLLGIFVAINSDVGAWDLVYSNINIFGLIIFDIVPLMVNILWMLPIIAWFMLVSSFSRRSPFLLAFIVPILIGVFEGVFFRSTQFAELIASRFYHMAEHGVDFDDPEDINIVADSLGYLNSLADPSFWVGTAVAAAMIYGCIQIRKRNNIT